jgi:flavin reductase (DIM6/NTAB) family NADH-FMN oxidoreductase RutF
MNNANTSGTIVQEYKIASSRFATGVTITTALRPDGSPLGLTVSSFTSLSLDPPLILVSIQRDCRAFPDLRAAGFFGVNVLAAHQQSLSLRFASGIKERFACIDWYRGKTGVPLLRNVLASFECALESSALAGDHEILIGRVLHVSSCEGHPLVRFSGSYCELLELPSAVDSVRAACA